MHILVGEIGRGSDGCHFEIVFQRGFQNPGVEDWGFFSGIGADQKQQITVLDSLDFGVHEIVGTEVRAQFSIIGADFEMVRV